MLLLITLRGGGGTITLGRLSSLTISGILGDFKFLSELLLFRSKVYCFILSRKVELRTDCCYPTVIFSFFLNNLSFSFTGVKPLTMIFGIATECSSSSQEVSLIDGCVTNGDIMIFKEFPRADPPIETATDQFFT